MTAQIFGNRWQLGNTIASGGQAEVFAVTDRDGEHVSAVLKRIGKGKWKAQTPESEAHRKMRDRFRREVAGQQRLAHDCIVEILAADSDDTPPWLVMPHLGGGDLCKRASELRGELDACLTLLEKLADALAYAHSQGVIHRDLHPGNVMFRNDALESVVLVDFGICRLMDDEEHPTAEQEAVGPEFFRAPELAHGRLDKVDPRCDVYSLGKLFYFALTGGGRIPREDIAGAAFPAEAPARLHPQLRHLLGQTVCADPAARLSTHALADRAASLRNDLHPATAKTPLIDPDVLRRLADKAAAAQARAEAERAINQRNNRAFQDAQTRFVLLGQSFGREAAQTLDTATVNAVFRPLKPEQHLLHQVNTNVILDTEAGFLLECANPANPTKSFLEVHLCRLKNEPLRDPTIYPSIVLFPCRGANRALHAFRKSSGGFVHAMRRANVGQPIPRAFTLEEVEHLRLRANEFLEQTEDALLATLRGWLNRFTTEVLLRD